MSDEIVIGGDMEDIPEGSYNAVLVSIETRESVKFGGEFRVWKFKLENGSEVEGSSSMWSNPKSKPGRWIAALLGRKLVQGESVDVIGKTCIVQVIEKDGYPKVDNVLPPMKVSGAKPVTVGEKGAEIFTAPAALPDLP